MLNILQNICIKPTTRDIHLCIIKVFLTYNLFNFCIVFTFVTYKSFWGWVLHFDDIDLIMYNMLSFFVHHFVIHVM